MGAFMTMKGTKNLSKMLLLPQNFDVFNKKQMYDSVFRGKQMLLKKKKKCETKSGFFGRVL